MWADEIFLIMVAAICCDLVFFYFVKDMFNNQVNLIQGSPILIDKKMAIGSVMTYLIISLGFYKFIVLGKKTWMDAFLLGVFAYGIYEMTNYALFAKWRIQTSMIDILWGGVLFTLIFWIHKNYLARV